MFYVPINRDLSRTYARIRALEIQLVDSGEMNADLREFYMYIFNCQMQGRDVERDIVALEIELRRRSIDSRREVYGFVEYLYRFHGIGYGNLAFHLPIFPDYIDRAGNPNWDWQLETPLRWADQGNKPGVLTHYNRWQPPTELIPAPPSTGLNAAAVPFIPRSIRPGASVGDQLTIRRPFQGQEFRPARVLLGEPRLLSSHFIEQIRAIGFTSNPRYEGTIDDFTVRNANCPDDENCSLFITNVDPNASTSEFFNQIHEGAIFSYHKKEPVGNITTSAISLVFTTRQAAVAFFNRLTHQGMWLQQNRLRVTWNRERVRPVPQDLIHQTRVLRITGPAGQNSLRNIIQNIRHGVAFVITHHSVTTDNGMDIFEIGFASIRGQSRNVMRLLAEGLGWGWRVDYAPDPCDRQGQQQTRPGGPLAIGNGPLPTGYGQNPGGNGNDQNPPGNGQRQIGNG